jgi:hypothetical protein
MRETSTSEGGNYPPILPVGLNFTRIPLGVFTCRKAGTWDILFYFPSEGRHTEDFSDARKKLTGETSQLHFNIFWYIPELCLCDG